MSEMLNKPVQPITVGFLVTLASLFSFILGGGFWAGVLQTRMDGYSARLDIAEKKLDKATETIATMNLTLVQMQAQLSYLVRATTQPETGPR